MSQLLQFVEMKKICVEKSILERIDTVENETYLFSYDFSHGKHFFEMRQIIIYLLSYEDVTFL